MTSARRLIVVASAALVVGCGLHLRPAVAPTPALPVQPVEQLGAPQVPLATDTIAATIAAAEREFASGQSELKLGHLTGARQCFDRAVEILLHAPGGARSDPRLSAAFDRLLDRINALETIALREGDGFSEEHSEPAVIDELLAVAMFERPAPTEGTEETVADDLAHTAHDLPITVNDRVLSFIELFQGNLRDFMEDGLERSARYLPMIQGVFKEAGLPLDLAYVPLVESAFKPNALSRASARGIWQFELGTARDYGLHQDWFVDERSDPEKATRAAAEHLKMLLNMFDGDWDMALASYNAGQGRVQRAVRQSKINDYWKLTATSRYLPRETREYVPMILAAIIIAKNPTQYGFGVPDVEPFSYDTVTVPDALDLRVVAEWAGTSIDDIRELNPELRRSMTPRGEHELRVPTGTAAAVEAGLAKADPAIFAAFQPYTVRRGDTLSGVAAHFKVSRLDLASANKIKSTAHLRIGQVLMIPRVPVTALASGRRATRASSAPSGPTVYRVRPGDTLYGIARQFDTTVASIKKLNQLVGDRINPGDKLTVRR